MPYLPNLASPDDETYEKSAAALTDALERTGRLGGHYLVTHMGSHLGAGAAAGRRRVARAISRAVKATAGVTVLLENAVGKGNAVGTGFAELGTIYKSMGKRVRERVALCVDTCHAHVMAYDLSPAGDGLDRLLDEAENGFGPGAIRLLHLNDARAEAGAGLDRHENIGHGTIGREGFRRIVNHPALRDVPMVLETPQREGWDRKNLNAIRKLRKPREPVV
jgi:deoxyribonuclease-4